MRILAISGSLRAKSTNTALLRAAALVAPGDVEVTLYEGLGDLPMFNPDIEATEPPAVMRLWGQISDSDAVMIASPEYAHGITGVLKNALDWMVGCGAFVDKPVALLNASPRASHAQAALKETLLMIMARPIEKASVEIDLIGATPDASALAADSEIAALLETALAELALQVRT